MNQDFISQTPLDQITGTDYGQMLKLLFLTCLPEAARFSLFMKKQWNFEIQFLFLEKRITNPT